MPDDITKRMHYFDRQFLRAKDFQVEQAYHIDRRRRHNQFFHSAGVADMPDGLEVVQKSNNQITVKPGWAVDEEGREIVLLEGQNLTISRSGAGSVDIYISYPDPEPLSDESSDPGITGFTRVHEQAVMTRVPGDADAQPPKSLWLATVNVDGGGNITDITDKRQPAGVATGNIGDDAVTSAKLAEADGISGQDTNTGTGIKTAHLQDDAVTSAKLAEADGISGQDTNTGTGIKTAHLQDDTVTSAKLAEADGISGQDTNTGTGIKTAHLQDGAVTNDKIDNGTINETKFDAATREKLDAGTRGWVRLPFLPKRYDTNPEFQAFVIHAISSSAGATGNMEIPVPAGATALKRFRISGIQNTGTINIQLFRSGLSFSDLTTLLSTTINGAPFDELFTINQSLNAETNSIGLFVQASNESDIFLVAAEFE